MEIKEWARLDDARVGLLRKMTNEGTRKRLPANISIIDTLRELKRRDVTVLEAAAWCKDFDVNGNRFERQLKLRF